MNYTTWNKLVRTVVHKNSLDDCSISELQKLANDYPYFSVAQMLLALKLQESNSADYTKQLQKLSLYIQDPLWMEQLLTEKGDIVLHAKEIKMKSESVQTPEEVSVSIVEQPPVEEVDPAPVEGQQPAEVELPVPQKTEPVNVSSELTFEPYHTVDYFASQGIRMKEEDQPRDKFGQQLKSFTEWLKTLKKLPVAEISVNVDSRSEKKVEQMAEHSISEREVVTEAMAEVWEKQGNMEKAIATYRKLSLLNPSKSSYFAAKIEQLKTI